ncbi:MAG: OmpA family protein, partial [Bacteroidota bacterium]
NSNSGHYSIYAGDEMINTSFFKRPVFKSIMFLKPFLKGFLKANIVGALTVISASAQQTARPAYGIFGDYSLNNHSANFQNLPGIFTCGSNYTSGSGGGLAVGGLYEMPIMEALKLSLRAGYASDQATLTSTESQLLGVNGEAQNGTFEKSLVANISSIGLEPILGYQIYKGINLHLGGRLGFLMQKSYEQKEEITSGGNTVFTENNTRTRNQSRGDIENTSALQAALLGGLSYDIPLNAGGTFIASPEVFYSLGLTSFVSDLDWSGSALRAGVAFKMSPAAKTELPPEPEPPVAPPVTPKPPVLTANIDAVGITESGSETALTGVVAEEFLRKQSQPVLPYIFFDDNSSEIPARYSRKTGAQAAGFTLNQLYSLETLEAYHEILNIIGKRLQENPSASITLSGYNSNTGSEKNNTNLSKQRAENVKNYLTNTWNIPASKITIQSKNLPPAPSNIMEPDGIEENRRVEISASSPEILAPLVLNDTLRTISPQAVRFKTSAQSGAGLTSWNIALKTPQGNSLKEISGAANLPQTSDVKTEEIAARIQPGKSNIMYSLETRDKVGQVLQTQAKTIPAEIKTIESKRRASSADKEIENYSLMLFEFDKADLSAENERITRSIKASVKPNANVTVTGYTDRFGNEDYNLRLSENRARNVAKMLGISPDRARGLGESVMLYDNNLPEGRFYSRTINITVETPIEK